MHRFFTEKENISTNFIDLKGSDVGHIRKVLRLKVGDQIEVLDGEASIVRRPTSSCNPESG